MKNIVILISGTGSNMAAIVRAAGQQDWAGTLGARIAAVVSNRADAKGLAFAREHGIAAEVLEHQAFASREAFDAELSRLIDRHAPALVVLAGFMRILPPDVVDAWPGRMLNIHPSLLPRYPGLHTYRRALAAGDSHHGSTVHFVIPALDAGPGILQYRIAIRPGDDEASLRRRVLAGEHLIYPQAIGWVATGRCTMRAGAAWLDGERLDAPLTIDG